MNQRNYFFSLVLISFALNSIVLASAAKARPQGAPPTLPASAYTACEGKSEGDAASDEHVSGTCETGPDGKLALRPSGPPPDQSSNQSSAQ